MTTDTQFAYVAADPDQPGAAWACCVDKPEYKRNTAKSIAEWARKGAHVMRVDVDTAREMMMKWERPAKKPTTAVQQSLI